jgi:outer membrane lipopolysaccharide assembly protein LptE/RlpB
LLFKLKGKRLPRFYLKGICFVLSLLVTACGYRFSGGGELPGGIKKLNIGIFENRTNENGFESQIANDLIYQFTRFGNLQLTEKATADASLTGTIKSVTSVTISHANTNTSTERRIQAIIALKLSATKGGLLWADNAISAYETYAVSTDKAQTEKNKKSALTKLSSRVAERIYYRLTDNF